MRHPRLAARRGPDAGYSFDRAGGPLLAVCGLVGGAGTTTIALSIARHAARSSSMPILLAESSPERAGVAPLAGGASPICLRALAAARASGSAPERVFVVVDDGLRLIATTPQRRPEVGDADLLALLFEARSVHGLVVIDCGVISTDEAPVLQAATHIVWALPRAVAATRRAAALLSGPAAPPLGSAHELVAVSATRPAHRPRLRELRALAAARCERLVLIPFDDQLAQGRPLDLDSNATGRALGALGQHLHERV